MNDQSKFGIVPAKDPLTPIILQARMDVLTHPELTDGAKALFCLLLDLSLNSDVYDKERGRVVISTTKLCEMLSRSRRAVYSWKQELTHERFIKCNKKPMPNCKPITRYWIAAIHPKAELTQTLPGSGLYGNGKRVPESPMPAGARAYRKGKKVTIGVGLVDRFGNPVSSILLGNEPATRTNSTLPPASFAGDRCIKEPCSPQDLREEWCKKEPCHPQDLRGASARFAGATRTNQHSSLETKTLESAPVEITDNVQRGIAPPQAPSIKLPRRPLNALGARKGINAETDFLDDVRSVLATWDTQYAKQEMEGSGAWWRLKYRQHPSVMPRVLAEVGAMIKEGTIKTNPGAAAVDLLQRWAR